MGIVRDLPHTCLTLLVFLLFVGPVFSQPDLPQADFGDAPETYASARHLQPNWEWLGGGPNPSVTVEPAANRVNRDPLDDGLDSAGGITVSVGSGAPSGGRRLNAWVDWNDDGTWNGADEHVVVEVWVTQAPGTTQTYTFDALDQAFTVHWIRVTLTRDPFTTVGANGAVEALFGETEDYPPLQSSITVTVTPPHDVPPPPDPPVDPVPPGEDVLEGVDPDCIEFVQSFLTSLGFAALMSPSRADFAAELRHWADFPLLRPVYSAAMTAVADYFDAHPAKDDLVSNEDGAEISKILERVWIDSQVAAAPVVMPVCDAADSAKSSLGYCVPAPARVVNRVETNGYDEIHVDEGVIFAQAANPDQPDIGERLDCGAYTARVFGKANARVNGLVETQIAGSPACLGIIRTDRVTQIEALILPGGDARRAFSISVIPDGQTSVIGGILRLTNGIDVR